MHRSSTFAPPGGRLIAVFAAFAGACVSNAGSAPELEAAPDAGVGAFESMSDGLGAEQEPRDNEPGAPPAPMTREAQGPGRARPIAGVAAGHGLLASPSFRMQVEVGRGVGSGFARGESIWMTSAAAFVDTEEGR